MKKKNESNAELEAKLSELKKVYEECKEIAVKNGLNFLVDLEDVGSEYGYTFNGKLTDDCSAGWQICEIKEDDDLTREQKDEAIKKVKEEFKGYVYWHNSTMQCELGNR